MATNKGERPDKRPPRGKGGDKPRGERSDEPRGRPRAEGRSGGRDDDGPTRKPVGGVRNEHGTRISRRVECSRCGKTDHVPWGRRDRKGALCRACASELLNLYEVGTKKRVETRPADCNLCGVPFELPVNVEDDGDLLCPNCLRGFMAWQGDLDVPWEERSQQRSEARPSGTLLRRRSRESTSSEPASSDS